jgi:hypothetical protein
MSDLDRARLAFLNMVADALRFEEETNEDEDTTRGRVHVSTIYHLTVGHDQLLDLTLSLGIEKKHEESLIDSIDRAVDAAVIEVNR